MTASVSLSSTLCFNAPGSAASSSRYALPERGGAVPARPFTSQTPSTAAPVFRDPFHLFTAVLLGVDPDRGLFVAFDPARHFPEDEPLRDSISAEMVRGTLETGWHSWLREGWEERDFDFAEALVGFRCERLLHYLFFERIAHGLDTGHRSRLAEKFLDVTRGCRRAE